MGGVTESAAREAAERWREAALAHKDASRTRDLWSVYGMLRAWLLAPERLSAEARQTAPPAIFWWRLNVTAQLP